MDRGIKSWVWFCLVFVSATAGAGFAYSDWQAVSLWGIR